MQVSGFFVSLKALFSEAKTIGEIAISMPNVVKS